MTLGRYVNSNTFLHRLDPRGKFIMLFTLMVAIFLINPSIEEYKIVGWIIYLLAIIASFVLFKIAKLKYSMVFKSLKMMWFMMIFLFVVNLFVYKEGLYLFSIYKLDIYLSSITQTLKIVVRLLLLINLSTLFTATTKPLDITVAIDDLFSWLKVFKVNVSILSMMISIALRFIPTILDETYRIMKAQSSRGVDFVNGKIKEKITSISALIIPLFISSIARSDELANAMEARNYNPLAKRSRYRILKWHSSDTISLIVSILVLASLITLNVIFKNNSLFILSDTNIISFIKDIFNK